MNRRAFTRNQNGYSKAVITSEDAETLHLLDKRFIRNEANSIISGDEGYAFCKTQLNHIVEKIAEKFSTSPLFVLEFLDITKGESTYKIRLKKKKKV